VTDHHFAMPLRWIGVDAELSEAPATAGLIYRTKPKVGYGIDGRRYFFKGAHIQVVMAEVLGYSSAEAVNLSVPPWAVCRVPPLQEIWFASEAVAFSGGIESLIRSRAVANAEFLAACIAFDIWTANTDRNIGNIVAGAAPGLRGKAELFAIDFEQAQVLNGTDFMTVGALASNACTPKGILAELCRGLSFPWAMCGAISRITLATLDDALSDLELDVELPRIPWMLSAKRQLVQRAAQIETLVREVWDGA
jgi:hypothetical protein